MAAASIKVAKPPKKPQTGAKRERDSAKPRSAYACGPAQPSCRPRFRFDISAKGVVCLDI